MEIMREIKHLEVDLKFSDMTELDMISKILPNLSTKEKLKVLHFGRMSYWWGFDNGEQKARKMISGE